MTAEDDKKAHDALDNLRTAAKIFGTDAQITQITELENKFGPQAALKITGDVDANRKDANTAGSPQVKALLQRIQADEKDHPDPKRDAMEKDLQDAIKHDPAFVDRLEAALKKDPKLADAIEVRYMNNPDGMKAQIANLAKPNADISAVVNGVAPKPGTANTAKFNLDAELGKVDPSVKDGVKKLFDAMMGNAEVKKAFDDLKSEDEKRDLIQHLGKAAKDDPKFLDNAADIVKNKPQLVASSMEHIAEDNDTAGAFNRASTRTNPSTDSDKPDPNNPLSGLMSMLGNTITPLFGRIASVFGKLIEGILSFFENLFGGGTHGVSSNPNNPVLSQRFPGMQMGPDGPVMGNNGRPAPSPLVRGNTLGQ